METIQAIGIVVMSVIALVVLFIGIRNQWNIFRQDRQLLRRESEMNC